MAKARRIACRISDLTEALPHGSGIDAEWHIAGCKNGNVKASCSYHYMNEHGYYMTWYDFTVTIFRHKKDVLHPLTGPLEGRFQVIHKKGDPDFRITFAGAKLPFGIRDYLESDINYCLQAAGIIYSTRTDTITAGDVTPMAAG